MHADLDRAYANCLLTPCDARRRGLPPLGSPLPSPPRPPPRPTPPLVSPLPAPPPTPHPVSSN